MNPRNISIVGLAMTALLWSSGGVLIKSIQLEPLSIASLRSAIAVVVILMFQRSVLRWPDLWQFFGALAYASTVILFVIATKWTTAANAILLQYTAPIYVFLLAPWIVKEKSRWFDWMSMCIALLGMYVFFLDEVSFDHRMGNIMAIGSGISFAFLALLTRKQKDADPLVSIFWGNILAAVMVVFVWEDVAGNIRLSSNAVLLILLGVFQLALPYFLYVKAAKHLTALELILIPMMEPVLNPIWVFLFLKEVPGNFGIFGGGIVLMAVLFRSILSLRTSSLAARG